MTIVQAMNVSNHLIALLYNCVQGKIERTQTTIFHSPGSCEARDGNGNCWSSVIFFFFIPSLALLPAAFQFRSRMKLQMVQPHWI